MGGCGSDWEELCQRWGPALLVPGGNAGMAPFWVPSSRSFPYLQWASDTHTAKWLRWEHRGRHGHISTKWQVIWLQHRCHVGSWVTKRASLSMEFSKLGCGDWILLELGCMRQDWWWWLRGGQCWFEEPQGCDSLTPLSSLFLFPKKHGCAAEAAPSWQRDSMVLRSPLTKDE